jgi:uncharacterized phiE125 gp8 family phage protein
MTIISKPVQMAVSLDDARTAARLDGTDLDAQLEIDVRAFTREAEHCTGRAIIDQTHRVSLDAFPEAIQLPVSPVRSVVVQYCDPDGQWQTLDPADYELDNEGSICYVVPAPGKAWPATQARINAVRVDALCGYGPDHTTTPDEFKAYILGKVAEKYAGVEAPYLDRMLWSLKVYA